MYLTHAPPVPVQRPLASDLYALAKQLDPTRLVNTADGVFSHDGVSAATIKLTNPQDFRSAGAPLLEHYHDDLG